MTRKKRSSSLVPMDYDQLNEFCSQLPSVTHVVQWGGSDVWKVGGKVFCVLGWQEDAPAFSVKTTREDYEFLVEQEGIRPAPYLASRGMSWVQHYGPSALSDVQLTALIVESHTLVAAGLTKKKRAELDLE